MLKPTLHFLNLDNFSIFDQLQIEEAILRLDNRNWCLINTGSKPAIVMGISGKSEKLINPEIFKQNPVPVIRRFSGGGTVFVNEETLFTTFICNSDELNTPCSPQAIFQWSEKVYNKVFDGLDFKLQENDYVIGNQKFGGNAQYIRKNRWLHHSSLLFDYNVNQMNFLSFPEKVPTYRMNRHHSQFLCKLNNFFSSKEELRKKVEDVLNNQFNLKGVKFYEIEDLLKKPHRKSTTFINFP